MATIQLQHKKGHMDFFSLYDKLLLPKQSGFWHCCSQLLSHVEREHDTNLMILLGRLVNILGRLKPLLDHSLSQGPLGVLVLTWRDMCTSEKVTLLSFPWLHTKHIPT